MPLTPEQERIKALFGGDPRANFAGYTKQPNQEIQPGLAPTAYNSTANTSTYKDFTNESPLLTQTLNPSNNYQQAIRRRLGAVDELSVGPTQNALMAQQQRAAQQMMSANNVGTIPGVNWQGGTTDEKRQAIVNAARGAIGTPYSWGGGSASGPTTGSNARSANTVGFDCSGLVLYAYGQVGMKLPHYSGSQLAMGQKVPLNRLQPGDLVGEPGHVAVYAGNGMMIEAPNYGKTVRYVPVRSNMFGVHINL